MVNYAIQSVDLCISRGGTAVLRHLDIAVDPGSITGLLGPSGCGKTTLMRAIVGTQRITSGMLSVLDRPAGHPALRAQIGYASQQASVYDDLTVAQNIHYFGRVLRAPAADVSRVMDEVDLTGLAGRLTGRLSGGQRSRVSLAVAMLASPRLLVLDEPTVGLDPVLREDLWSLFRRLADRGLTVLVSSHVMEEAERCDDLLLMRDGKVLTHDSPQELMQRTGTSSMDAAFLQLVAQASKHNKQSPA